MTRTLTSGCPSPGPGYKSKSFISFPIALGPSPRSPVVNLTDRVGGVAYDTEDLALLELCLRISP